MDRLRVLTWHVHGNYLWYLSQVPVTWVLPVRDGRPHPYGGRAGTFPWPDNVVEVPAAQVRAVELDAVLFQAARNWDQDQHEILSPAQRRLPRIHLEHDPPRRSPTNTRHPIDDPAVTVVHVTPFNQLMWDNGDVPTRVVEHGVIIPDDVRATYEFPRGLVAVNGLASRGRRLGRDVFERLREAVPLDLVGMESTELGGLGEIPPPGLAAFAARYRYFFTPIRYTSLGLAICEAMAIGLPIVGLATTELPTVVVSGEHGYLATHPEDLVEPMRALGKDPDLARRLGENARTAARQRFGIARFVADWCAVLSDVTGQAVHPPG